MQPDQNKISPCTDFRHCRLCMDEGSCSRPTPRTVAKLRRKRAFRANVARRRRSFDHRTGAAENWREIALILGASAGVLAPVPRAYVAPDAGAKLQGGEPDSSGGAAIAVH